MNGSAGDAVGLRQLAEALSLAAVPQYPRAIEIEWFAADVTAFELRAAHTGADAFDDKAAFQLRDASDDDDNRPTQRTAGIDLFAETDKLDIDTIQLIEHFQEVFH